MIQPVNTSQRASGQIQGRLYFLSLAFLGCFTRNTVRLDTTQGCYRHTGPRSTEAISDQARLMGIKRGGLSCLSQVSRDPGPRAHWEAQGCPLQAHLDRPLVPQSTVRSKLRVGSGTRAQLGQCRRDSARNGNLVLRLNVKEPERFR